MSAEVHPALAAGLGLPLGPPTCPDFPPQATEAFLSQQAEQETASRGLGAMTGLSAYQKSLLQKVEDIHAAPLTTKPSCSTRTAEQALHSLGSSSPPAAPGFARTSRPVLR